MSDLAFNKILSEICLFFVVLSTITYWESAYALLLVIGLGCSLSAYFASKSSSFIIRTIIGLVPFVGLVLAEGPIQLYGMLVVCVYTLFVCASGKFYINYWTYKMVFGLSAIAYLIFLLIVLSSDLNSNNVAFFGLIFLVNGVIALRRSRMGAGLDLKGKAYNALEVIGVVVLGAGAMLTIYFLLTNSTKIVEMILMPFALIFFGIGKIAVKLGSLFKYVPPELEEVIEEIEEVDENALEQFTEQVEETTKTIINALPESFWRIVIFVLFAALILFLIYKVTQSFSDKTEEKVIFDRMDSFIEQRRKRKLNIVPTNAERLRQIYKDYLKFVKRNGVIIKKSSTSEDVLLKSETIGDESVSVKLRELYIQARYADEKKITDEDVNKAKEYLQELIATTK